MDIQKTVDNNIITFTLTGRLDTITSPALTTEMNNTGLTQGSKIILDFGNLEYISSAGLGVVLAAQKKISAEQASLEIINVSENINEIFTITGFSKFLNLKTK